MANKPTQPVHHAKVLTPEQIQEQKRNQAVAIFAQKRETIAVNLIVSFIKGNAFAFPKDQDKQSFLDLIDLCVEMADHLMEKLYPVKEEGK